MKFKPKQQTTNSTKATYSAYLLMALAIFAALTFVVVSLTSPDHYSKELIKNSPPQTPSTVNAHVVSAYCSAQEVTPDIIAYSQNQYLELLVKVVNGEAMSAADPGAIFTSLGKSAVVGMTCSSEYHIKSVEFLDQVSYPLH